MADGMDPYGEPRKLYVQLDALEKIHRTEVRRVRALHYLQRRAIDLDILQQKRVEEALQLAQEDLARLRDEYATVTPQTAQAATMTHRIEEAEGRAQSLLAALDKATVVSAARKAQRPELHVKQDREQLKLVSDFSAQMGGRDLEMAAPVLKLKVQGITLPVTAEALPPLVETVKASLADAEKAEQAIAAGLGPGGSTSWAADAARLAGAMCAQVAEEEEEAEAEEGGGGGGGAPSDATLASEKKKNAARKDRRTPEEEQRDAVRKIISRYAARKPCAHCGAHALREAQETCSACSRVFCGRGDKGPEETRGQPCIDMQRCRCGTVVCYDCYLGSDSGCGVSWMSCAKCGSHMCPSEWAGAAAGCTGCAQHPFCRSCRDEHTSACPRTLSKPGFARAKVARRSTPASSSRKRRREETSEESSSDDENEE